jgi:hypothetical protein
MSRMGSWLTRRIRDLSGGCGIAALLALALAPPGVRAAELTSVDIVDPAGLALDAKVTVTDAATGLPVAGGRTDSLTGRFSFSSLPGYRFVVTVNTSAGYVGSETVASGATESIFADAYVDDLPKVTYLGTTVTLQASQPVAGLRVALVAWSTFQPVAQGVTDSAGQCQLNVPLGLAGLPLLGIIWDDTGASLRAVQSGDVPPGTEGSIDEGFPTF